MRISGSLHSPVLSIRSTLYPHSWGQLLVRRPYYFCGFILTYTGPVIGGFVIENKDFRWHEWLILFMVAFSYIYCIPQSETSKKTILQRRARKKRQSNILTPGKGPIPISDVIQRIILKPFKMLFVEIHRPLHDHIHGIQLRRCSTASSPRSRISSATTTVSRLASRV